MRYRSFCRDPNRNLLNFQSNIRMTLLWRFPSLSAAPSRRAWPPWSPSVSSRWPPSTVKSVPQSFWFFPVQMTFRGRGKSAFRKMGLSTFTSQLTFPRASKRSTWTVRRTPSWNLSQRWGSRAVLLDKIKVADEAHSSTNVYHVTCRENPNIELNQPCYSLIWYFDILIIPWIRGRRRLWK